MKSIWEIPDKICKERITIWWICSRRVIGVFKVNLF